MPSPPLASDCARIRKVRSFEELMGTPFGNGVNALCWERSLPGGFGEVVEKLGLNGGEPITSLDAELLHSLPLSPAGREAADFLLKDLHLLTEHGLAPELNRIQAYPRDEEAEILPTHVYSFHADSAPVEADTWLCTYHGPPSEGLPNEQARRHIDIPETRAELLRLFGGGDDESFREWLNENAYDLHYAPTEGARPWSFGLGNLWRIATEYPGSPVPPCIHRAPETLPGEPARLLLIS